MKLLDLLVPRIPRNTISGVVWVTLAGALAGGLYGVIHDQMTYSIGPEYFTRLKFDQFHYARPANGSERWFAAKIGFLASWWVGALTAWVLARVSIRKNRTLPRPGLFARAFAIVFLTSMVAAVCGYLWARVLEEIGYSKAWLEWLADLGVTDIPSFMEVACIHNASYLGGGIGMILGVFYLIRHKKREASLAKS